MSASLPLRSEKEHYRSPASAPVRLPVANESTWETCALMLPACKGMEPRAAARHAKARRYSIVPDIIAFRIGLRRQPAVLGRFVQEISSALSEPLDGSTRPLTDLLLDAAEEDAEGDTALVQLVADESIENLRRFLRESDEKIGALVLARDAAQQLLNEKEHRS